MIHVISKWQIDILFEDNAIIVLYIHDDFEANVLRKLAEISFPKGIEKIVVAKAKYDIHAINEGR